MPADSDPFDGTQRPGDDENKAFAEFLRQFGVTPNADGTFDMNQLMGQLQQAMTQISAQMSAFGAGADANGLNWSFTRDIARKVTASQGPDPSIDPADVKAVRDAVTLADLWLDAQTSFDRISQPAAAWSRAEWIEGTFDVWKKLVTPVATSFAAAIGGMASQQGPEAAGMGAVMEPMMRAASSGMLAAQVGQSLGLLSTDVVSACDISIPVTATPVVALLPHNVAKFAKGLEQDAGDVRLYLALRETARQRLFAAVGWLGPQLIALIEHYARGIAIDSGAIERALESQLSSEMTPDAMAKLGETLSGKLFEPVRTAEQNAILDRLETLVALVEGWVDDVVSTTTAGMMPGAGALLETVRRRRATGGPAEQALKSLLNLELRPRRVRDAANLWAALRAAKGTAGRDAAWAHPDLIPTAADLDDPLGYVERGRAATEDAAPELDDMDAQLAKLLDAEGRSDRGDAPDGD